MQSPHHPLEQLWQHLHSGDIARVTSLFAGGDRVWDDPIFNRQSGDAVASVAVPALSAWYRERARGGADAIVHFRTTADEKRVVVETMLDLRDGVTWNQAAQRAEPAAELKLAVAVVGDRAAGNPQACSAIRVYFGTWSVLKGAPKVRVGPIAPDERIAAQKAMDAMPTVRKYFDCLATGKAEIADLFEPDGYFREPANNFACGPEQLKEHFNHILKLGGVGIEFLTATREEQRLAIELQTIKWGSKKMQAPQAGFAIYELGPHGLVLGSRVYDSVVPPEF